MILTFITLNNTTNEAGGLHFNQVIKVNKHGQIGMISLDVRLTITLFLSKMHKPK